MVMMVMMMMMMVMVMMMMMMMVVMVAVVVVVMMMMTMMMVMVMMVMMMMVMIMMMVMVMMVMVIRGLISLWASSSKASTFPFCLAPREPCVSAEALMLYNHSLYNHLYPNSLPPSATFRCIRTSTPDFVTTPYHEFSVSSATSNICTVSRLAIYSIGRNLLSYQ